MRSSLPVLLLLTAMTGPCGAAVPDGLVVQGRASTPSTALSGTATVQPAGLSQPFSATTDSNGVFQFTLTGLSPAAFADPGSTLELLIGTATIAIPFRTVPYAFRAAQADGLASGATVQIVNIGTITVANLVAASATFSGSVSVLNELSVGSGTIRLKTGEELTVENIIEFSGGNGSIQFVGGDGEIQGFGNMALRSGGTLDLISSLPIFLTAGGVTGGGAGRNLSLTNSNFVSAILVLQANSASGNPPPQFRFKDTNNGASLDVGLNAAGNFVVEDSNNVARLVVQNAGNVGIGTANPLGKLDVEGGSLFLSEIAAPGTPAGGKGAVYAKSDGKLYFKNDSGVESDLTAVGGGGGAVTVTTATTLTLGADSDANDANSAVLVQVDGAEKLRVNEAGNVGIGTTNPSGRLDIEGGDLFVGPGTLTNATAGEDVSVTGNIEVDGTLFGNGAGLTSVTAAAVANGIITSAKLADGSVTKLKLAQDGCTEGQILKLSGGAWACAADASGAAGAVSLSPGSADADSDADSSIFINDTGGGNLLRLQQGGVDRFVISNAGVIATASVGSGAVINNSISGDDILDSSIGQTDIQQDGVGTSELAAGAVTRVKIAQDGCTEGQILKLSGSAWACAADASSPGSGIIKQYISSATTSSQCGGTAIPNDNTVPQNDEGLEVPLNVTITPQNASNTLVIEGTVNVAENGNLGNFGAVALFRDNDADAIASWGWNAEGALQAIHAVPFSLSVAAGSTAPRTYHIRVGTEGSPQPVCYNMTKNVADPGGKGTYGQTMTSTLAVFEIGS